MVERKTRLRGAQVLNRSIKKDDLDATGETTGYVATVQADGSVEWAAATGGGGGGSTFKQTFITTELDINDKIVIQHNLDTEHPDVIVYNNLDRVILPTEITYLTSNTIELDFSGMTPLVGTYKVRVFGATGATGAFLQTFGNSDLDTGATKFLPVEHNLGQKYVLLEVYDNNDLLIISDEVTLVDTNNLQVDLTTYAPISGNWNIIVSSGGAGSGSGSSLVDNDNDTKIEVEQTNDEDKIRFTAFGTQEALIDIDGLTLKTGASINEFSTDGTLAGNSDDAVPTEQAVKTYVDTQLSTVSSDAVVKDINQSSHGFVVGDWLGHNGTIYVKAQADNATNAEVYGVVSAVADANNFSLTTDGYVTGLSGLTAGEGHFLSSVTAGAITATATTTEGEVIKPVLIADSTTSGYVVNMIGTEVVATTSFYQAFTSGDLTGGTTLNVTHNLGHKYCQVEVYNDSDKLIVPDDITLTGDNTLDIDLSSFTVNNTWRAVILDVGTTNSETLRSKIQDSDTDTSVDTEQSANENLIRFKIAGTEQIRLQDGALIPTTDNDVDLGSTTNKFKDLYLTGASLHLGSTKITESRYSSAEQNIVLNAFRTAINGSLTQFNMVDGIVDEYEDESGISPFLNTPYAHYKLNDNAANTTVTDDGTGANNGTASVNTSTLTDTGKINEAFHFDGSTHYIDIDSILSSIQSDTTGTISLWMKPDSTNGRMGFALGVSNANAYLYVEIDPSNRFSAWCSAGAGQIKWGFYADGGSFTASADTWYHIVLVQDGVSPKMYIDGVDRTGAFSDSTDTTKWVDTTTYDTARIGCINYNSSGNIFFHDGFIDDVRYYQNRALTDSEVALLYNTGAGTEDSVLGNSLNISYDSVNDLYSPSKSFSSETKLALHMNGTDASTTFTDDSPSAHTVTANGNAQLDTAQFKFGSASGLFDGTGDYLTIPDSDDFSFGSGDFTIHFWVRFNSLGGETWLVSQYELSSNNAWIIRTDGSNQINFTIRNELAQQISITDSSAVSTNTWYHIAATKSGSTYRLFKDGVSLGSGTYATALSNLTDAVYIGAQITGPGNFLNGWLDEIIIIKGTALWTSGFTPPTAEDTGDPNNMTLQSNAFTAEAQPDSARINIFEEDVDTITLNTDLVVSVSRDGGTTFSNVTLTNEGEYEAGKNILSASVDISGQPAGTEMIYKITTANNKDLKIHGTGLSWD